MNVRQHATTLDHLSPMDFELEAQWVHGKVSTKVVALATTAVVIATTLRSVHSP